MLSLLLLACAPIILASPEQRPLFPGPPPHPPEPVDNSTAPFIFNSLSSLLVQWPNTYHQNGHTIIPGFLEPFTLLYHARKDANVPPPSPEWFAFDSEMSYGIMAGRGGNTYLLTYRNIQPARIVYFDGMSAALSETGWLDSQEVLIAGKGRMNSSEDYPSFNEYRRALSLCKWGEDFGVEGFVRMNAGFELLWCDFSSPALQLVSHLNITAPGTPPGSGDMPSGPPGSPRDPVPTGGDRRPTRPSGGGRGRSSGPFSITGFTEWLRAASQRGSVPQAHVLLDHASLVTFYHPRLHSLVPARVGQTMRQHRIWPNISIEDAQSVKTELEEVLRRPPWAGRGSGLDWGMLARDVVEKWASRIVQLREFLGNASAVLNTSAEVNTTETLAAVRRLTYSPLNLYMDTGSASNSSAWDSFVGMDVPVEVDSSSRPWPHHPSPPPHPVATANTSALRRCMYSATGFLNDPRVHKTAQEVLLQTSIETVMQRLCMDYGMVFIESMDADDQAERNAVKNLVDSWEARVMELIQWLDWTEWLRCDEVCPRDSVCTMQMWPVGGFGRGRRRGDEQPESPEDWKPRCMSLNPSMPGGPGGPRIHANSEVDF
ncbi:hypothetical protein WOLCODRAFT_136288 [Wolfiporia cocos MD-104 SS10]|uniref:Uncharacterized protein n=1 Tax=Wolfiporia cocos (strain MD-104) TaxID=742152 RepID=A0A2H3J949_WOLCO|nr:hypothetical protein WOLCODRAFT_136288 [Wolfiporia cocos MD-104 SS10]